MLTEQMIGYQPESGELAIDGGGAVAARSFPNIGNKLLRGALRACSSPAHSALIRTAMSLSKSLVVPLLARCDVVTFVENDCFRLGSWHTRMI